MVVIRGEEKMRISSLAFIVITSLLLPISNQPSPDGNEAISQPVETDSMSAYEEDLFVDNEENQTTPNYTVLVRTLTIHGDPLPNAYVVFSPVTHPISTIEGYTASNGEASFQVSTGQYKVYMDYPNWLGGFREVGYCMVKNVTVSSNMTIMFDPNENARRLQISALDIEGEPIVMAHVTLTSSFLSKTSLDSHLLGLTDDSGKVISYVSPSQYHVVLLGSTYFLWERSVNVTEDVHIRFEPTLETVGALNLTVDSQGFSDIGAEECHINYYCDLMELNDWLCAVVPSFIFSLYQSHGFESRIVYAQPGNYRINVRIESHILGKSDSWTFLGVPSVSERELSTISILGGDAMNITWGGPLKMKFYTNSSEYSTGDSVRLYLNITDSYEHRLTTLRRRYKYGNLTINDSSGNVIRDEISFLEPYTFQIPDNAKCGIWNCSVEIFSSGLEFYGGNLTGNCSFIVRLFTDLNNDGTINIQDLFMVAKAFQTKPGDENWDPRADLDGNDLINIADLYEVAKDYGKTV